MNAEDIRLYCLAKKGVMESFPFNEDVLVFKVMDKIFLLSDLSGTSTINLKCNPEYAIELREKYPQIVPGYHMNKKHWNTVQYKEIDEKLLLSLIDHSYTTVVTGLSKKKQAELEL